MPAPIPAPPVYPNQGPRYTVSPFGPFPPSMVGTALTVSSFLSDPLRVERVVQNLAAERFLVERIFSPGGPATGGAVIFEQALLNDLFLSRDVQAIAPGSEFPLLTDTSSASLVARTTKWGGEVEITYEARDRDRRDLLNRAITRLRNTIVRKVDAVAVATLRAAPIIVAAASGSWTLAATTIIKDAASAQTLVDQQDMGYVLDTVLVSPATMLNVTTNDKILQAIYYNGGANGLVSPITQAASDQMRMQNLLGMNWYPTNRVTNDEVFLLASGTVGSISDEKPLYTRVVDQPLEEKFTIMGARLTVPYVTDPKSCVRISGVA